MKTTIITVIEHKKPLPAKVPVTDAVSQRIYGWLYSQGVEAAVSTKLMTALEDEILAADTPRAG